MNFMGIPMAKKYIGYPLADDDRDNNGKCRFWIGFAIQNYNERYDRKLLTNDNFYSIV